MTYQIIYSSESSTPMQLEELDELLEHARSSNSGKGITGALVYVDGIFLQILEGERHSLQELMKKIYDDVRHETVTVLKSGEIPFAAFTDWKMAYISATTEQVARWAGLRGAAALPEILNDMRQDQHKAKQVAASILSVLVAEQTAQTRPSERGAA